MQLTPGTRLGPYEITAFIGAGGMGEVYRASDSRLGRTVAIKIMTSGLAPTDEARIRFAREARSIAALSHPHICPLFDVGREGESDYLVMEYLDGETLADRLTNGRLPLEQALRYAIEIAAALSAAHAAGIVHRDLKPGNVILTKSGAKLLDFGLAKPRPGMRLSGSSDLDTDQPLTGAGILPGTLHYMAPEQLEGRDADARSDIFALGAVLFEMSTGRKAFDGPTQAAVIARVLESDPPAPSSIVSTIPPAFDFVVRTALAKLPDARWQSAQDVLLELRWLDQSRALTAPTAASVRASRWGWAVAAALGALLTAVAVLALVSPAEHTHTPRRERFDVTLPETLGFDWPDWPVVSPDGQRLAFTARLGGRRQLWTRAADGVVQPLPDTFGATFAFWSPDSHSIAFVAGGKLKRVDVSGGPPVVLTDSYSVSRGTWSRNGVILFVPKPNGPIHMVRETGGVSQAVTTLDHTRGETSHQFPTFLPDGRHFLYAAAGDQPAVLAASIEGGPPKPVLRSFTAASYTAEGYLIFHRQQNLMAQRFNVESLQVEGAAQEIAASVAGGAFSADQEGTLVYRPGVGSETALIWVDREGRRLGQAGTPAQYQQVELSPSGRQAAVQRVDPETGNPDIWVVELATGVSARLTLDPAMDGDPAWSPDERNLAFTSFRSGKGAAYLWDFVTGKEQPLLDFSAQATAAGRQSLTPSLAPARIPDGIAVDGWTADGQWLVVRTFGRAVYGVPMVGERVPRMLADTPYVEDQTQVSPDGKWIAFNSDESGRWEVYVATFPAMTDKRQISIDGGMQPRWKRDSKELYYLSLDGTMMAATMAASRQPEPGMPRPLFQTRLSPSPNVPQYDVVADASRFLILEPAHSGGEPVTFVLNWAAGVKP